jgi:hypothetical protein
MREVWQCLSCRRMLAASGTREPLSLQRLPPLAGVLIDLQILTAPAATAVNTGISALQIDHIPP